MGVKPVTSHVKAVLAYTLSTKILEQNKRFKVILDRPILTYLKLGLLIFTCRLLFISET